MKRAVRKQDVRAQRTVAAAAFKTAALAVMRHVHDAAQPVTITSRGKPLVRIEPIRQARVRTGYGAMRGTVELLVRDEELVQTGDSAAWRTVEEWQDVSEP